MRLTTDEEVLRRYDFNPPKEKIPELMLLGSLASEELLLGSGEVLFLQVITCQGKKYVMKMKKARWFDEWVNGVQFTRNVG